MENKAQELISKAEDNLTHSGCFNSQKQERCQTSAQLYQKAGNIYKLTKEWKEAANAFIKAAELFILADETYLAIDNYISSSNCLKKVDALKAIDILKIVYDLYMEDNKYYNAAKYIKEIAIIYEELENIPEAKVAYQKAAEIYEMEDKTSLATECFLKIADLNIQLGQFSSASELYQKVAEESIKSTLLKFKCKEYLLKAGLSQFCNDDIVDSSRVLNKYCDIDATFSTSREYKLLSHILNALENSDLDLFTNILIEYDSISTLTPLLTKILVKLRSLITDKQSLA